MTTSRQGKAKRQARVDLYQNHKPYDPSREEIARECAAIRAAHLAEVDQLLCRCGQPGGYVGVCDDCAASL